MKRHLEFELDDRTPEQVYDQIADALPSDQNLDPFGRVQFEMLEGRRPDHVAVRGQGKRLRFDAVLDFAPGWDGGTRVTADVDVELRGVARPFGPLLDRFLSEERLRDALAAKSP